MSFLLFNVLLLLVIIVLLIFLSWIWPPDSPWSPWWKTSKKTARAMCELASIGKEDVVYELGSGDGTALIIVAKEFGARGVGIEIDPLRYYISKIAIKLNGVSDRVKIIKGNFFDYNFSDATVVYFYLVPKAIKKLKPKFLKELKPQTRIVSLKYESDLVLAKKDDKNDLRLYRVKD